MGAALLAVYVEGELQDDQNSATDVFEREVHLVVFVVDAMEDEGFLFDGTDDFIIDGDRCL